MPRKKPIHIDPARAGGSHVMVRVQRSLAAWASNLAITLQPKQLPDVKVTRIEPSRSNVMEQCLIWGLQRLDPRGRQSEFGVKSRRSAKNPARCPLCKQQLPHNPIESGALHTGGGTGS